MVMPLSIGTFGSSRFLIVMLVALGLGGCGGQQTGTAGPQTIPVRLQKLDTGVLENSTELLGNLESLNRVQLKSQIEGRVTNIPVNFGQPVKQGDLLFRLEPDQTAPQLAGAMTQVSAAEMALKSAQANLQQAIAQRGTILAELEFHKTNIQRAKLLVDQGAAPQVSLDEQTKKVDISLAQLKAQEQTIRASQAAVNQAQANLQNSRAQVATAAVPYQFKQIRSPIAGVVGNFSVRVGDVVSPGQVLTTINQNNPLDLVISVPSTYNNQLRQGTRVDLLDPKSNQLLSRGQIYFVSPAINNTTQSILTRARFPNPGGQLRDGQTVRARVIWNRQPGILVPVTAVSQIGGQNFVFVAQTSPCNPGDPPLQGTRIVCQQKIDVGPIQEQKYQVLRGLRSGDEVAVSNILNLRNGVAIKPET
jgi:RND family efflux transporter MFP subunit